MKEGWMENNESSRMNDEEWWFQAVEGFLWLTDERMKEQIDICECRVAIVTENLYQQKCRDTTLFPKIACS